MPLVSDSSGSSSSPKQDSTAMSLHSMAAGEGKNKNTPHYHFIHSMILPSTIKLQRELKSRKFKVRNQLSIVCFDTTVFYKSWIGIEGEKREYQPVNPESCSHCSCICFDSITFIVLFGCDMM